MERLWRKTCWNKFGLPGSLLMASADFTRTLKCWVPLHALLKQCQLLNEQASSNFRA